MISRTLGGHIIWPVGEVINQTINQIRGRCANKAGVYDRIDVTLYFLKAWYEKRDCPKGLRNSFERSKLWLNYFDTFSKFVEFFVLDSYVDKDYNVYDLASFNEENGKYILYDINKAKHGTIQKYCKGSIHAINIRNEMIKKMVDL